MNSRPKTLFSWSGGKDSALALYELLKKGEYEVESLLTTVTADYGRVSMHGLRTELLHSQSKSSGLSLEEVLIQRLPQTRNMKRVLKIHLQNIETGVSRKSCLGIYSFRI